jgi:hypothetical protein
MDSHRALLVINILQAVLLTLLFGYLGALHLEGAKTLGNLANSTQDIQVALTFGLLRQDSILTNMTKMAEDISKRVALSLMKKLINP